MSKQKEIARFSFEHITKGYLGAIWRPFALCELKAIDSSEWQPVKMIIDTGADYTVLPKQYALLLGIDINLHCHPETTAGIGGSETVYLYKNLPIRIGVWEQKIPVGFLERSDIPPLLGRLKGLEQLMVIFNRRTAVFK